MKTNKLVFENSVYSLLLCLMYNDDWDECDYIFFGERLPLKIRDNIESCLKKSSSVNNISLSIRESGFFRYFINLIMLKIKVRKYDVVIGNVRELTIFPKSKTIQISDGLMTSFELVNNDYHEALEFSQKIRMICSFRRRVVFKHPGRYLIEKKAFNDINKGFVDKVKLPPNIDVVDISKKWKSCSEEKRKVIRSIFGLNFDINKLGGNKTLLVTQPLSEEGLCSFEAKVNGYKRLVLEAGGNYNDLVVKPHPREEADYSVIFPGAIILSSHYPLELLFMEGASFNKVLTLWSSISSFVPDNVSLYQFGKVDYFQLKEYVPNYPKKTRV